MVKFRSYHKAQNVDSRKLWQAVVQEHFGRKNIGRLAALYSNDKNCWQIKLWWIGYGPPNHQSFLLPKFCNITLHSSDNNINFTTV